jgi:PAS domain S-box-containing protein
MNDEVPNFPTVDKAAASPPGVETAFRRNQFSLDHAPDGILWVGPSGGVVYANQAICSQLGYSQEELLTKSVFEINPEFSPVRWAEFWQHTRTAGRCVLQTVHLTKEGRIYPVEVAASFMAFEGEECVCGYVRDTTERKKAEQALEQRLLALTGPTDSTADLRFEDLFDLADIQAIQDAFAEATGVASIITDTKGKPLTRPSNFCHLCQEIIRKTEKGLANCYYSDEMLGRPHRGGPRMQPCLSGGLWDGGASIQAGDRHVANWLIGQVLDEQANVESMVAYGRSIGADEQEFRAALGKVRRMPQEQFAKVCQALYLIAAQLSRLALQNLQQARYISDRKRIDEALRESERRFSIFMSHLPAAAYLTDSSGKLVFANQYLRDLFGWKDCLGSTIWELLPPELAETVQAQTLKTLTEGGGVFLVKFNDQQGRERVLENRKFPIPVGGGTILIGCIGVDITEAENAEQRLRDSETKYRELVELANSIILRWTPDGRITFLNEFGLKFFGFTAEEILGRHVVGTIVPETESTGRDLRPLMNQVCADPRAFEVNINENMRRNGERVWIAWTNKTVLDKQGTVKEVLSVGSDLTERRRLEEQLRHAQKMEAIGQLAGGVAHDFNNILTVILGNADLLHAETQGSLAAESMTRQITEAGQRAAALTRQLLLFSRKQVMDVRTLDLNEVIGNMLKMLHRILGEDITLHAEFSPSLPPFSGDAGMIEQVLLNLSVNARDAMPAGGRLDIRTSSRVLSPAQRQQNPETTGEPYLCLSVGDSGCGIPADHLPHIFEPFFTTKPVGKGTGLGLATAYGILKQHHGFIEVASEIGKGTTFSIFLPSTAEKHDQDAARPEAEPMPRGTETLLVVEDEPPLRHLVCDLLRRCGYQVHAAESGVAALELWKQHRSQVQLLLTDMIMPEGLTGRQLAERLQQDRPDLKVIFTSGYSPELVGWENTSENSIAFLQKPYSFGRLAQTVRRQLDQR